MLPSVFIASVVLMLMLLIILPFYVMYASRRARLASTIPGPKPLPIIGNALEFGHTPVDITSNIIRLWHQFGFVYRIWFGNLLFIFIADPKYAEHILTSNVNIKKSINYRFLEPWLGTGLLTSFGSKWKQHRKIITPTFHFKILDGFIDVFIANGNILIQKLKDKVDGPDFDIYEYITHCALDVMCEAAMGVQMNIQNKQNIEYVSALHRLCDIIMKRSISPWLFPNFIFNMSSPGKQQRTCLKILHDMSYKIIAERRNELFRHHNKENETVTENDIGQKKRLAFLDLLLHYNRDGGNLSIEEIREEVDTFMFEGHDTTASGFSFCLRLLAENPQCQEKAYEELNGIFGDSDREITAEDLPNMKYLECVIKESLRLYPSVPFFLRELVEDVTIDEVHIAAGTTVCLAPLAMHRHPEYFPDPEKFVPERFSTENARGRNPYVYVPFSAGPRNCIGQKFAMIAMKAIISKILRNFKLTPGSKDLVLSAEVVLRSSGGIYIKLENRK